MKVDWIRKPSPTPFGQLATIEDPDGNYIQLAQVNVDPFADTTDPSTTSDTQPASTN
jgi:hypothetical protein